MSIPFEVFVGLVYYAIAWIVYFLSAPRKHQFCKDPSRQYTSTRKQTSAR